MFDFTWVSDFQVFGLSALAESSRISKIPCIQFFLVSCELPFR